MVDVRFGGGLVKMGAVLVMLAATACSGAGTGGGTGNGGNGGGTGTGTGGGGGGGGGTGTGTGGGGGSGCIDTQTLTSGYWGRDSGSGTLVQIAFNADGSADQQISTVAGGDAWYKGQWTLSCPTLDVTFSDGADPNHFTVQDGPVLNDGQHGWKHCNGTCW